MQMNEGCRAYDDIADLHADDLRHPGTGVVEQCQHEPITMTEPAHRRDVHHGKHLLPRQEADHWPVEALHRNRPRLFDDMQVREIAPSGEPQERPYGGQSNIAAAYRVVPISFQVLQE